MRASFLPEIYLNHLSSIRVHRVSSLVARVHLLGLLFSTAPWCSAPVSTRNIAAFDFWFAAPPPKLRLCGAGQVASFALRSSVSCFTSISAAFSPFSRSTVSCFTSVCPPVAPHSSRAPPHAPRASPPVPPQPSRLHPSHLSLFSWVANPARKVSTTEVVKPKPKA